MQKIHFYPDTYENEKSLRLRTKDPNWEDVEWSATNSVCYFARLRKIIIVYKNHFKIGGGLFFLRNSQNNILPTL